MKNLFKFSDHERSKMMARIRTLLEQGRQFNVVDDRGGEGVWRIEVQE